MIKCKKCKYYYRTMAGIGGYNPAPYCHYFEDTGNRPNVLSQECFKKRTARRKENDKSNGII